MAWGDKTRAIRRMLDADAGLSNREVAKTTGCSRQMVAKVREAMGLPPYKAEIKRDVHVCLPPEQVRWLERTCPEGVSLSAHIASIITDAMWEDQHG